MDYGLAASQNWRLMFGLAAIPAALMSIGMLFQHESPHWLAAHGQSERARRVLWYLFTVSALNVAGDDANLSLAATVVRTALLGARDAADIGTPAIPLGDLHGQAAARLLDQLGASVRLGAKVTSVQPLDSGGFQVRLADRGVSAAPPSTAPTTPARTWPRWTGWYWRCRRRPRPGCCRPVPPRPARALSAGASWALPRSSTCMSSTTGR